MTIDYKQANTAYDKIDRYLRNNLDDADYADFSDALETVYDYKQASAAPAPALTDEQIARLARQHGAESAGRTVTGKALFLVSADDLRALLQAAPQPAAQPELHAAIMSLPDTGALAQEGLYRIAYRAGHRDARHAAAELVAATQAPQPAAQTPAEWIDANVIGNPSLVQAMKNIAATQAEPPAQTSGVAWPAPLSVERIAEIAAQHLHFPHDFGSQHFARAIEAAHGIGVASPARALLCEHECAEARLEGKPCGAGSCALLDVPPMSDGVPGTEGGQQA